MLVRTAVQYGMSRFERVDWSIRGEYMLRKHGIAPDVADEALTDPNLVTIDPDYNSTSGRSIRVIGFSISADSLLTIIVLRHAQTTYGVNGWPANEKDRRIYSRHNQEVADGQED